ncbi:hypothetical protein [Falsiroseomonas tokyonensis]|uniref:Uncharacterized protein n=1 Tax=Falsiroseomonas tokyonensis TaxID=430521 RepID=A0ABV7BX28_9PROT|nr:hypothetical protein [Falsiroseomonas tokyonensis]MBU8540177.1 hypothetical protein [Falsiroseomonas tokyonensis]
MVAEAGNTLLAPPRRTGDTTTDLGAIIDWLADLFRTLSLEANVIGTSATHTDQIADLEARLAAAEERLAAIAGLASMVGPIVDPYQPQQLADAYDKLNAIINAAK